jgi:Ca2+-binding EF-hand superfamily protein
VEPNIKQIIRGCIYKCAQGVLASDCYDHSLYEDVTDSIRAIESELGCEPLNFDQPLAAIQEEPDNLASQVQDSYRLCRSFEVEEDNDILDSDDDNTEIDVAEFTEEVERQSAALENLSNVVDDDQLSTLYENKDMLLTIFKFMDTDGNGTIDMEEFQFGIDLLNKRLPAGSHFKDHEVLFRALDVDGNGEIDIDEFNLVFSQNASTSEYTWD